MGKKAFYIYNDVPLRKKESRDRDSKIGFLCYYFSECRETMLTQISSAYFILLFPSPLILGLIEMVDTQRSIFR